MKSAATHVCSRAEAEATTRSPRVRPTSRAGAVCVIALLAAVVAAAAPAVAQTTAREFRTIVIDPGHGGKDPGAIGAKFREKNLVLDVALKLGRLLADSMPDLRVVYTRQTDEFIELDRRAEIANQAGADLFVSIHANSSKAPAIFGAETYVLGLHRSKENLEVAQKENSVISLEEGHESKYEGFDPSLAESYIMFELMQNVYLEQSIAFASRVEEALGTAGRADRGVKQAGFLVLRATSMPSVLVELGFLSNADEERWMATPEGGRTLTGALYQAIKTYRQGYASKSAVRDNHREEAAPAAPQGINWRVQVAATKSPARMTSDQGPVTTLAEGGVTKQMIGLCPDKAQADKLRKRLEKKYPGCFLVAFDGDKKISNREAERRSRKD